MKHKLMAAPEWAHLGLTEVEEPVPVGSVKEFWEFVYSLCHGGFGQMAVDEEDRWWELRRVWCLVDGGQRVGYAECGFCPHSGVPTGWKFHVLEQVVEESSNAQ